MLSSLHNISVYNNRYCKHCQYHISNYFHYVVYNMYIDQNIILYDDYVVINYNMFMFQLLKYIIQRLAKIFKPTIICVMYAYECTVMKTRI